MPDARTDHQVEPATELLMHAAEVRTNSRDEFAKFIRDDLVKWSRLVQASGSRSAEGPQ